MRKRRYLWVLACEADKRKTIHKHGSLGPLRLDLVGWVLRANTLEALAGESGVASVKV